MRIPERSICSLKMTEFVAWTRPLYTYIRMDSDTRAAATCHERAALSLRDLNCVHVEVWRRYRKLSNHVHDSY